MAESDWVAFVERLAAAGYFQYAAAALVGEIRSGTVAARSLFGLDSYGEMTGRVVAGDAEMLAEGGVLAFLFEPAPFLKRQGVGRWVYLDQEIAPAQFTYTVKD